jgi:hypothetical protein
MERREIADSTRPWAMPSDIRNRSGGTGPLASRDGSGMGRLPGKVRLRKIGQVTGKSDRHRTLIGRQSVGNRSVFGHYGLSYSNIRRARCSLSKPATCSFDARCGRGSMLAAGGARCWLGRAGTGVLRAERAWQEAGERVASGGAIRPPDAMNNRTLRGKEEGLDMAAVVHGALGEEGSRTCRCGRRTRPPGRPGQE